MSLKKAIKIIYLLIIIVVCIILLAIGIYYLVYISINNTLTISDDRNHLSFNDIMYNKVTNPLEICSYENEVSSSDKVYLKAKYKKRISTVAIVDKYNLIIISDIFGNEYYQTNVNNDFETEGG